MVAPLLHRLQQIAFELEGSEGTAESVAAADADVLVQDVTFEANIEKVKRDPARRYLTPLQNVLGKQYARVSFDVEVKGSGAVATAPSWGKLLKACKMQQSAVVTIAIGAITGGPFVPGDVVTGGTSNATGLVVDRYATGVAAIALVVLTGTFQNAEVLTGSLSAATATTAGTATAAQGYCYRPVSTGDPSATIAFFHDGKRKQMYGARGKVSGGLANGGLGMFKFEFEGIYDADTDVAMLDPTYESQVPVTFLDCSLYLDAFQPDFTTLDWDLGNEIQMLETAQSSKGARAARIVERAPMVNIDPYATLVADFDWLGKLKSSTTSYMRAALGSAAGNKIVFAFPRLSYEAVKQANRGSFQTLGVTLAAVAPSVSRGDDEVLISML